MSLCVLVGGKTIVMAVAAFTLSWTHSIERTEWREDWQVTPAGLKLVEARVKGSGAGMEPPDGARLEEGWWVYRPAIGAQSRLVLAASGATQAGWKLCGDAECMTLGETATEPIEISACDG